MPSLSLQDVLFSVRTFLGAALALYIAFALNLDRPYWAFATAYIVAQPLTGAMRSKGLYRFLGTLLGATASVVLVPNLVDAPELGSAAVALWVGFCLFFALLDRTPRSYVFMLAAYSAAIIGLPNVAVAGDLFTVALTRVEEIGLGIVCTSLVGALLFPRAVGPVLVTRINAWMRDAERCVVLALDGRLEAGGARRQLAIDAGEIANLAGHLGFDRSNLQTATRSIETLRHNVLLLLPVLSSITDRVVALHELNAMTTPLAEAMTDIAAWAGAGRSPPPARFAALLAAVRAAEPPLQPGADWPTILRINLSLRLAELLRLLRDCRSLQSDIGSGRRASVPLVAHLPQHRDRGMALLSAFAAALTVGLICAFWIATAWDDGAVAAEMAAVACCFFAAQDDPAPAILRFLQATAIAIVVDAVYLFAILPAIDGYVPLMLAFAPTFLGFGLLIARPATSGFGMALASNSATLLSLQSSFSVDAGVFLESSVAVVIGMATALTVTRLVRSVGADWMVRRLIRASWKDLADAAAGSQQQAPMLALLLDRLGLAAPRLQAMPDSIRLGADAVSDLRVGLNVVELRALLPDLAPEPRRRLGRLLADIEAFYRARVARLAVAPPAALLGTVDAALAAVTDEAAPFVAAPGEAAPFVAAPFVAAPFVAASGAGRLVLMDLVGVRRGLFPKAPPYQPRPQTAVAA